MTPREMEALTAADLAAELGWSTAQPPYARSFLEAVRDAAVREATQYPIDALEVPERVAQDIADSTTLLAGNRWRGDAERLALILLRAYTPEDP